MHKAILQATASDGVLWCSCGRLILAKGLSSGKGRHVGRVMVLNEGKNKNCDRRLRTGTVKQYLDAMRITP